jgi:hypothetical protein
MVTNVSHSESGQENQLAIRVTTDLKKENTIVSRRQIWKWFGIFSTLLIVAAALVPNAFGIPLGMRPWVFLGSIFWIFAFCAGIFDR